MRKGLRLYVLLLAVGMMMGGCKGSVGPAGADGVNGTSADRAYLSVFTTGVSPSASYAGVTMNRIDSVNTTTIYSNDGNMYFASAEANERSVVLVKFNIAGLIPTNAVIHSAIIEMVALGGTNLGGAVTVGARELRTGSHCAWDSNAKWSDYNGIATWGACNANGWSLFNTTACESVMGTAVLTSAFNGGTNRIGLAIAPSAIRDWLAGDNNGVAIISEHEGADAAGLAVFAAPNPADANLRPTLKVNYSL